MRELDGFDRRSASPIRGEIDLCRNVVTTPSSDRSDQAVRPVHNARTNNQPCNSGAVAKPPEPLDLDNVLWSSSLENSEGAEWQRPYSPADAMLGAGGTYDDGGVLTNLRSLARDEARHPEFW